MNIFQWFIISLKFLVPAMMLSIPFLAVWANYFLDIVDGDVLMGLGMNDHQYQLIDKSADYISYIFMLILGSRWKIKNLVIGLFVYRTIGQALFFVTGNELWFFYFQNFLEPLMMVYTLLMFKNRSEEKAYLFYKKHIILIWTIILAYKLWNEWYLHFANIDLSTLFFGINGG